MLGVEQLFYEYQRVTNDQQAAAILTLADVMNSQKPNQPEYLTVAEAAKVLSISPHLVYQLCRCGRLRHERLGTGRGTIRIASAALRSYQRGTPVHCLIR